MTDAETHRLLGDIHERLNLMAVDIEAVKGDVALVKADTAETKVQTQRTNGRVTDIEIKLIINETRLDEQRKLAAQSAAAKHAQQDVSAKRFDRTLGVVIALMAAFVGAIGQAFFSGTLHPG